jgi:signal transduction histidine kinase
MLSAGTAISMSWGSEGHRVVFRVSDPGPDVPQEDRHRLFDPFFTTREEGTGMGLSE